MKIAVKYFLVLCLVFYAQLARAARRPFYGRIVDVANAGIPFGVIESKDHHYRFYLNEGGFFNFLANPDSIDIFTFSAPGYTARDLVVEDLPDDSIIIELSKRKNILKDVTIGGQGNRYQTATSGISSGWHNTSCYLNIYDEIAVYLNNDAAKNGMIEEVGAYITKEGLVKNDFKIHIYAMDTVTGGPGEEITDSELVVHARKGNEWVTADLTDKYIQMHGGVYISVEWTISNNNNFYARNIPPENSNYYAGKDSLRTAYNGQVLGMAWQGEQPKVYRRYASNKYEHKEEGKWYLTPPTRGGHKGRGWITPMLYCRYSYVQ